jgi:hypothetical protein
VDNVFFSATPVVQDMANPFQTIAAALAAVAVEVPSITQPWRIVIRPGTYVENITTQAYVDIYGSGITTIIQGNFVNPVGGGPCTLSSMLVQVPSNLSVQAFDTLTIMDSEWFFTPASTAVGSCFNIISGAAGTPSLRLLNIFVSEIPTDPTTVGTSLVFIPTMGGSSTSVVMSNVVHVQNGVAPTILGFDQISGMISASIRNCKFDLTVQPFNGGSPQNEFFIIYGGNGALGLRAALDLDWSIDNCEHIIRNGTPGVVPTSPLGQFVLTGFTLTPSPTQFIVRDSKFEYVDYPPDSPLYSSYDTASSGDFITLLDNKWTGPLLTVSPTGATPFNESYIPYQFQGNAQFTTPSNPIVYEAISSAGSVAFSGGLQVGVTIVGATGTYVVKDADGLVVWAVTGTTGTLILPAVGSTVTGEVYIGKTVMVYNNNSPTGGAAITTSCSGPANTATISQNMTMTFATYDSVNWIVVSSAVNPTYP